MEIKTDGADHNYIEIEMGNEEQVRVTFLPESWSGESGIRINIRDVNGKVRQGPEFPISILGEVVSASIQLLEKSKNV